MLTATAVPLYVGIDVGKSFHHLWAESPEGAQRHSRKVDNTRIALLELLVRLRDEDGIIGVCIDQDGSCAQVILGVCWELGVPVHYVPGLIMRRTAQLSPGRAKTDERDARVIASVLRENPHRTRLLLPEEESLAEIRVLAGYDDDLTREHTRCVNRLRDLLLQVMPEVEKVLGEKVSSKAALAVLVRWATPAEIASARSLSQTCTREAPRAGKKLAEALRVAARSCGPVPPGGHALAFAISDTASHLQELQARRAEVGVRLGVLIEASVTAQALLQMTGVGPRTAASVLAGVGDIRRFPTPEHLASYAGVAPVTTRSGTSISGERGNHYGNRQLKRAMFLSAFASTRGPGPDREYYLKKRSQGKRHNQAVMALARRRSDAMYTILQGQHHGVEDPGIT